MKEKALLGYAQKSPKKEGKHYSLLYCYSKIDVTQGTTKHHLTKFVRNTAFA